MLGKPPARKSISQREPIRSVRAAALGQRARTAAGPCQAPARGGNRAPGLRCPCTEPQARLWSWRFSVLSNPLSFKVNVTMETQLYGWKLILLAHLSAEDGASFPFLLEKISVQSMLCLLK